MEPKTNSKETTHAISHGINNILNSKIVNFTLLALVTFPVRQLYIIILLFVECYLSRGLQWPRYFKMIFWAREILYHHLQEWWLLTGHLHRWLRWETSSTAVAMPCGALSTILPSLSSFLITCSSPFPFDKPVPYPLDGPMPAMICLTFSTLPLKENVNFQV